MAGEKETAAQAEHVDKLFSTSDAQQASNAERETTVKEALKTGKKAIFWSCVISMAIVMEGYDTALLPSFYGYPSFQKQYGEYFPSINEWQLSGPWQAGLSNSSTCGVIIGGFINGWASNRFGYKKTMLVSLFFMNAFLFITFFAPSAEVLAVGEILCGIPWGVFATTGPSYASEVCPLALRGYLTIFANLCWAIGQLIANGVLKGLVNNTTQWSYRIPFAVQWVWPVPLFILIIFAPESPWWLARKNRIADAEKSLRKLSSRSPQELNGTLSQIIYTTRLEEELETGGSYLDCFKGIDLRRTEICCMIFAGQMLSGAQFAYGPTYFFEQAGMSVNNAYAVGVCSTALAFLGTCFSWVLVTYFGRRVIYLTGMTGMSLVLLIIGVLSASSTSTASLWAQASMCLVWQLVYSLSVGPVCYAIISETSAVRLRAKTVVLARNTYNIVTVGSAVLEPYMMNPTEWNWKGKTAFFWCGAAALTAVWTFFRLPECKGRTYEELDVLFAKRTPARKFKSAQVDAYEDADAIHAATVH